MYIVERYLVSMPPCNESFQVCVRLYKANQRVRDPEMDNLLNIHEVGIIQNILRLKKEVSCGFQVKHWMDPQIIPYGWGLFSDGEEVRIIQCVSHLVADHSIFEMVKAP